MKKENIKGLAKVMFAFAPDIKDLPRLYGYIEVSAFDRNRIKIKPLQMFNMN